MKFDFNIVWQYLPLLITKGLTTTLSFIIICMVIGLFWGFLLSLARISKNPLLYWSSTIYVEFFRGTPVLVQLFWIFFCLPLLFGTDFSAFTSSVIALSLYSGAIMSESFRASLKSIEPEQYDACQALGLSPFTKVIYIVFPQAVLRAVPNLLSNLVSLFKESALVSAVGMADLMYLGNGLALQESRPVEFLTAVAFIYFIVGFALTRAVSRAETSVLKVIQT